MRAQPHRIAARLHRHQHARRPDLRTQALQRGRNRGGVMRKIVVHGDVARLPQHFQSPFDALKACQRKHHRCRIHTHCMHGGQRRQPVEHVMPPDQRPVHLADLHTAMQHCKHAAIGGDQACAPLQRRIETEALHRRPAAHRQHLGQARIFAVDDQPPAP